MLRLSDKNKMKRININSKQTHFIGCWNLENNDLCNEIINLFENNKNLQIQGISDKGIDPKTKKTTDITITPNDLKKPKFEILKNCAFACPFLVLGKFENFEKTT